MDAGNQKKIRHQWHIALFGRCGIYLLYEFQCPKGKYHTHNMERTFLDYFVIQCSKCNGQKFSAGK